MRVPSNYDPRFYQLPFMQAMNSGYLRALLVWHRKSGKTKTVINFSTRKAFERIGVYYHCFPEYGQGRKIVWDAVDEETGKKIIDIHIPPEIRGGNPNSTEMKIPLINGSLYQIIGADNYDSLVGPNPLGLVLDEWAVSDRYPTAWNYFRPILAQNHGWAVFAYTPRGRNHGWEMYQMALTNPDWFCQLLTVDDTFAISPEAIEKERRSGMPEAIIQQEFYCSFLASTENIVIPFELIQQALRRDLESWSQAPRVAGVDVARFGNDRTAIVIRQGGSIVYVDVWQNLDITQTAGRILSAYRALMFDVVAVDVIGLGAGVYDMLHNAGIPAVPVNVSEAPSIDGRFDRLRDELWWKVREWFEGHTCCISKGIPENIRNTLVKDLQDIHYKYTNKMMVKIETKDEMKERLGFSPDIADALCCTFDPGVITKTKQIDRVPFVGNVSRAEPKPYEPLTYGLR